MKEYVSVDVETTGLAPKQDKIIEIGAVRVRDGQIVGSFTCFVNPGRILPAHITELTGILQEQVDEAETMESVLPAFLEFAGDLPLVGHRILFDYGFLKRAAVNMRLDFERSGVDTLKLSAEDYPLCANISKFRFRPIGRWRMRGQRIFYMKNYWSFMEQTRTGQRILSRFR